MPGTDRERINKKEIGARIKRLRKEAGLRQWQLAEMIGATQPAIHMYERGVLPEPKRLLELARIGNTTVEWILTGAHWENGSEEMQRVPQDVCELAFRFRELGDEERDTLDQALRIIRSALKAVQNGARAEALDAGAIARQLEASGDGALEALSQAVAIQKAVAATALEESARRLRRSDLNPGRDSSEPPAPGRRRIPGKVGSGSLEPLRGNIFRLDGSMLVLAEILKDKNLRSELEESIEEIASKLTSKKSKVVKLKKAKS